MSIIKIMYHLLVPLPVLLPLLSLLVFAHGSFEDDAELCEAMDLGMQGMKFWRQSAECWHLVRQMIVLQS